MPPSSTRAHVKPMPFIRPSTARARAVFGGEGLGAAQHEAVGDDQRNENAKDQIQFVEVGIHAELDGGDHGGDQHHEHRDTDLRTHPVADQRDAHVGDDQCQRRRQSHTQTVDNR